MTQIQHDSRTVAHNKILWERVWPLTDWSEFFRLPRALFSEPVVGTKYVVSFSLQFQRHCWSCRCYCLKPSRRGEGRSNFNFCLFKIHSDFNFFRVHFLRIRANSYVCTERKLSQHKKKKTLPKEILVIKTLRYVPGSHLNGWTLQCWWGFMLKFPSSWKRFSQLIQWIIRCRRDWWTKGSWNSLESTAHQLFTLVPWTAWCRSVCLIPSPF